MIYPANIEAKLGFDTIREWLSGLCNSPLGQNYVEKIQFNDNFEQLQKLLGQTLEFKRIMESGDAFPSSNYLNLIPQLRKAEIQNSYLDEQEWLHMKLSLNTAMGVLKYLQGKGDDIYPHLKALSGGLYVDKSLVQRIDFVIDDKGAVKDSASSVLQGIRRSIINEQSQLRRRMDSILKHANSLGYLPDDASPTIRNGRIVVPVLAEHKRHFKGFIHDESATGQTTFIEPAEIFELNNRVRELELEERREIYRILLQLTNELRPLVPSLYRVYTFLGQIDFIRAKAKLAMQMNGVLPRVTKSSGFAFKKARHPVLQATLKQQDKNIIPQNIELNNDKRLLIISGPNAGGKSVTLKTVGLLQYMLQCGLLIPVDPDSDAGVFSEMFIDMGDDQSLENDLSTYSSHLLHMRHFMEFAGKRTLYLIDEFGTGTEPQFGAAIAESILIKLLQSKAYGVLTTHYGNLKTFADRHTGVLNGRMRYDAEHLMPLYELELGKPGSSFALEIARKTGLPKDVLNNAKELLGTEQVQLESLILELEAEKQKSIDQKKEFERKNKELDKVLASNFSLQTLLENKRRAVLNEAKQEAKMILKQANQKVEKAIRDIKENKAEKEVVKEIRKELEEYKEELSPQLPVFSPLPEPEEVVKKQAQEPTVEILEGLIQVGDTIRMIGSESLGKAIAIKGKQVEVLLGDIRTYVKIDRLERVLAKNQEVKQERSASLKNLKINDRMATFQSTLDLRGARADEALNEISEYLDEAVLLGMQELRILHGKGDGILRKIVRNYLTKSKSVASVKDEHADRGGTGITLVTLG